MGKITPMLRQYRQIKARYPDAIVLFRLGDFYEMFDEDARIASKELELLLTSRRFSKEVKLPMCGVPYRRATSYIAKLLEKGYKVAIAEQLEDARKVKRLVKREVVRVITPGTVVEHPLLKEKEENFLVAISPGKDGYGLAVVDLSTGEFVTTEVDGDKAWPRLIEELGRLRPSEYVLPEGLAKDTGFVSQLKALRKARISPLEEEHFDPKIAKERLLSHFGVASLEAYGCDNLPLATSASGAVLRYLKENQISDLAHIRSLQTYSLAEYMSLDATTRRNLELTHTLREGKLKGSLLDVLDHTMTAMGARLLRRWIERPLLDLSRINLRLEAVGEFVRELFLRHDLRNLLNGIRDVERIVGRIGFGSANARDLVALRRALERIPRIKGLLAGAKSERLKALNEELDELRDVAELIRRAIVEEPPFLVKEGGLIKQGYNAELDGLRRVAAEGREWLADFEAKERERTGIKNLRVRYNEVFGFFIEVTKSYLHLVPPDYQRKATIAHAERFITPLLKAKEAEILTAEDKANELEYELFVEVRKEVASQVERLQRAARVLAELDALRSLAEAAALHGYVKPILDDGDVIEIRDGRHPMVERMMPEGLLFVPNDAYLDGERNRILLITGPNMSGKTVYIRQVALIVLMAQMGSFVPASSAHIGLVDRIFVRAGAIDDISQGRSTFLVEMSEMSYILNHATSRSFIVLDEVGRGTSTYDGMSLAWAVVEEIHDFIGARTLFATHYHELTELAEHLEGVKNYSLAVRERGREVIFLYRLVQGGMDKSYGVQVARLAGLPERVIERAEEVMARLEGVRKEAKELREIGGRLLLPVDDEAVWEVVREIFGLDIANMTPVQALVALNELQERLRR